MKLRDRLHCPLLIYQGEHAMSVRVNNSVSVDYNTMPISVLLTVMRTADKKLLEEVVIPALDYNQYYFLSKALSDSEGAKTCLQASRFHAQMERSARQRLPSISEQ